MKSKKNFFKMIMEFLVIVLIVGFFAGDIVEMTYASLTEETPDVIVTIKADGSISQEGNLLELKKDQSYMWYPGRQVDGVLRIYNQSNRSVKISSLGLKVEINNTKEGYSIDQVKDEFLDSMYLTITKGKLFDFEASSIVDNKFLDMINSSVTLKDTNKFTVGNNVSIDLKYSVLMDKEAGNELQDLSANVIFIINASENVIKDDDDDDKKIIVDIDTDKHWAHDCIITLLNHSVIQGYPHKDMTIEDYRNKEVEAVVYVNEAVQPDLFITRAEAAVLVGKALGLNEIDKFFSGYIDFIPDWARGHIISTTEADVFKGYPFARFKAGNYITREEMIAVLTRAFDIALDDPESELPFEDKDDISAWALENVKAGYEDKVIVGYPDNNYKPQNSITRAEAFTIICKLLGYHDEHTIEY